MQTFKYDSSNSTYLVASLAEIYPPIVNMDTCSLQGSSYVGSI